MENNNIIVAVVGLCGAGKSEVTSVFTEKGYKKVYFGDVTFDEMKRLGLEITPENERMVRESIRKNANNDMAIYAKKSQPKIDEFYKNGNNVIVESMYSWSEYKFLKEIYKDKFVVLGIVVDKNIRVKRLSLRPFRPLNPQQVKERDYTEIENIEKAGPIAIADYFITNNGSLNELKKNVINFIEKF